MDQCWALDHTFKPSTSSSAGSVGRARHTVEYMPALPGQRPSLLLEMDLTEPPGAADADDPLARLRARGRHQLRPILRALHDAAADHHVVGLIAKVGGTLPWAAMQELRLGVRAFAASGKPTIAWSESFGEASGGMAAYVLATGFDEIWLQPGGGLGMLGVGVEATFVRGALDHLGIEPQIEQRHEFKNAADIVMRTGFTQAHRTALDRLAESVFTEAVTAIAAGRGLETSRVRELADTGPRTAAEARDVGLVDALGYRDEVYAAMRSRVGTDAELLFADRWRPHRRPHVPARRKGHVALVEVRGAIVSGRSRRGPTGRQVGSDSVGAALRAATNDEHVRAVVLHIDSPGGSAVASDTIWREVCRVRDAGKPVVVSMGEAAASGGYYIACPADVIVALPSTLTGSIGVFGGKVVVRELFDRLGLTTGTVSYGARSQMFSARRGFSDDERERLAATIDAIYEDFVTKVARGRGRPVAEIESIARGRVWTGSDALRIGLVDELGGLRDAVRIARSRAGLPVDAPVRRPLHVAPLARLGRARNTEDPRAVMSATLPRLSDVAAALGLPAAAALRMPSITVR
jgi:protease-4